MLKKILLIIAVNLIFTQEESPDSFVSGNANFYFISKLDNGKILKLPYRMLNTSYNHNHNGFELNINGSLEYVPTLNNYSFSMDNPQDFLLDLREFYLTWYGNSMEISIGKQIHSFGFVDENSPLDNFSSYDYNFLFESGIDRKIGSTSMRADYFWNSIKLGLCISPFHQINRLPSSNAEFPIELPEIPKDYQFMDLSSSMEHGEYIQYSSDIFEVGLSYFSGYDRIFNLSGFNVWENDNSITLEPDTVFSYRKTDVLGVGGSAIISNLSLRYDIGYFSTKDQNDSVLRTPPNYNGFAELKDEPEITHACNETAKYYQSTIQLEYTHSDIDFLFQYFIHDTLSYSSIVPLQEGEDILLPLFTIEGFNPYTYFYPGMGSPLAFMTRNAILLGIEKPLFNGRAQVQLRNLFDLEYSGFFTEINTEYNITDNIKSSFAINYVKGDKNHPNSISNSGEDYIKGLDYPLNQMEDFSHFRMQLRYSF